MHKWFSFKTAKERKENYDNHSSLLREITGQSLDFHFFFRFFLLIIFKDNWDKIVVVAYKNFFYVGIASFLNSIKWCLYNFPIKHFNNPSHAFPIRLKIFFCYTVFIKRLFWRKIKASRYGIWIVIRAFKEINIKNSRRRDILGFLFVCLLKDRKSINRKEMKNFFLWHVWRIFGSKYLSEGRKLQENKQKKQTKRIFIYRNILRWEGRDCLVYRWAFNSYYGACGFLDIQAGSNGLSKNFPRASTPLHAYEIAE